MFTQKSSIIVVWMDPKHAFAILGQKRMLQKDPKENLSQPFLKLIYISESTIVIKILVL